MSRRAMVCILCPLGCKLEVIEDKSLEDGYLIYGGTCKRAKAYALKELKNPTRILTSTVKIEGGKLTRLPVRTKTEIPKDKILEAMDLINTIVVKVPVLMGDVLVENILDTGVDIIASRDLS